ncbi:proteasome accessory factor C [Frigoribacterium sp. PhB160]|uniref:helix-turn-helix transcriptional regulator n=1 Tax=Frigoribacterium sp. PhB160 TaxID=2485192 RepID=UPI000F4A9963|nr:WYL domain-containing protein [Frigoribacterium sp. PhB160]ROS62450.1 proteasome accessory factor C [Frigoribacterium sp. PhB160]
MTDRRPAPQATDKLALLLALVPWLIDNERVGVAAAAEHFGVSVAQIRRAVELIAVSGVPGETNQYQHGDLFDIAWDDFEQNDVIQLTNLVAIDESPRFSAREAAALIAGLQYLSSLPEHADRSAVASLMSKLSRGASAEPSQVAVDQNETDGVLALVGRAVEQGVQLEFDYAGARGQQERRRVDPLRVESQDADWYLRAWDHAREALRTFRVDRITSPALSATPIAHRAADVALPETLFSGSPDDVVVTVEIDAAAAPLLDDWSPVDVEPVAGDRTRLSLRVEQISTVVRLVAGLPGRACVVAPPAARRAVAEWADRAAQNYAD